MFGFELMEVRDKIAQLSLWLKLRLILPQEVFKAFFSSRYRQQLTIKIYRPVPI